MTLVLAKTGASVDHEWMSENKPVPNIYGVETEYSSFVQLPGGVTHELVGECHSKDANLGLYQEQKKSSVERIDRNCFNNAINKLGLYATEYGMLSNGSRLYVDISGLEYATAEHRTAEQAVHASFDGDEIMFRILRDLQKVGAINSFQLNRSIVDHNGSSRGVHINTATKQQRAPNPEAVHILAALNVVKGSLFGSGGLLVDESGETHFHHSPRLSITNSLSEGNYSARPLVRVPFKGDAGCNRIETITTDALNFAWPLRASMVMTNALVRVIELEQYNSKLPRLFNAVSSARHVGRFGNNCSIAVSIGEDPFYARIKPSEVLKLIAEFALSKNEVHEFLDLESKQVLNEVIEVADKIIPDPVQVMTQVESIARHEFMKRKMEDAGVDLNSEKMCKYDYYWDKIGGGIAERLRKDKQWGWQGFSRKYSQIEMLKRLVQPPTDTRAIIRGRLITETQGNIEIDWNAIVTSDDTKSIVIHPLQTEIDDDVLNTLESNALNGS